MSSHTPFEVALCLLLAYTATIDSPGAVIAYSYDAWNRMTNHAEVELIERQNSRIILDSTAAWCEALENVRRHEDVRPRGLARLLAASRMHTYACLRQDRAKFKRTIEIP